MSLEPGKRLGPYEIVGLIGADRSGRLRIDCSNTGFGLRATRYFSVSFRFIPAQSEISLSTLSSVT